MNDLLHNKNGAIDGTNLHFIQSALSGKVTKANKSGVRGVSHQGKYYVARIGFKGKDHYLGAYKSLEEAVKIRKRAEQILYGEWMDYYNDNLREEYESIGDEKYKEVIEKLVKIKERVT